MWCTHETRHSLVYDSFVGFFLFFLHFCCSNSTVTLLFRVDFGFRFEIEIEREKKKHIRRHQSPITWFFCIHPELDSITYLLFHFVVFVRWNNICVSLNFFFFSLSSSLVFSSCCSPFFTLFFWFDLYLMLFWCFSLLFFHPLYFCYWFLLSFVFILLYLLWVYNIFYSFFVRCRHCCEL